MTEQEQKIFDSQPESTKRLLRQQQGRATDEDKDYFFKLASTPVSKAAQCVKEDGSVDLNVRDITAEEEAAYKQHRYNRGAHIEKRWSSEQKAVPVVPSEEKKERAVRAYLTGSTLAYIKKKFKELMSGILKPTYAEHMASEIKKKREEL